MAAAELPEAAGLAPLPPLVVPLLLLEQAAAVIAKVAAAAATTAARPDLLGIVIKGVLHHG